MAKAKLTHRDTIHTSLPRIDEDDDVLPAPPDGGYGWVVVFASFMCNMVVDGITYCFGIFLPELVAYYGESKGKTAWVGSILAGVTMGAGPFVSALANKYGCRTASIMGSILASAAFGLSIYCPTIELQMLVYGAMGGLGLGLIYLPAVVCVGYYFETKRSLATGIAVCGSGVGTFALAPLARFLVDNYGWKGANLIFAGIILSSVIFGALMKPLEYSNNEEKTKAQSSQLGNSTSPYHSKLSVNSKSGAVVQPLARKDIFYSASVLNLKEFQSQKSLNEYRHSVHSIQYPKSIKANNSCSCLPASIRNVLGPILDLFELFGDPVFMIIAISNLFGMAALYIPFVYIVECAIADGIEASRASLLISIIGITNTIGRIICGYCADFPQINSLLVNNLCLLLSAVAVGFAPFCHTFPAYVAMSILFAIGIAGYISLTSIILVDLLGLDKLTNAFGLLILFRGTAALIGSPLAGILYDLTRSYTIPFLVASGLFAVSSATSFMVPFVKSCVVEKKNRVDEEALKPINMGNNEK